MGADCAITSMRFGAILFISPAVVSMLKTGPQLITLSIIQHFRGKKLNCKKLLCLVCCMAGLSLVMVSTLLGGAGHDDELLRLCSPGDWSLACNWQRSFRGCAQC